jgi:hypothetical protein
MPSSLNLGVMNYNYFNVIRQKQQAPVSGVNLSVVPQSNLSKLCIQNFDTSVTVGGQGGLPLNSEILSPLMNTSMGAESTQRPVLTPSVPVITYPVYGNGTYDAAASFQVDLDYATAIDNNGQPWLVGMGLFAVAPGYSGDPREYPYPGPVPVVQWLGSTLTAVWTGIGAGNAKDLYVAYQDGQGRYSLPTYVGTTNPNQAGASALLGVPTTPPNPSAAAGTITYEVNGGGTYDAECTITLDANGTTANNALAEIECVMYPAAAGIALNSPLWAPSGNPQLVNNSGVYQCAWGGCGVQVAYSIGIRFVGQNGSRSNVYIIGTTTAAQLAQIPFQNAAIDPTTGYIVITDSGDVFETYLEYNLPAPGVGSLLSASWSLKIGATGVNPVIWLFYNPASGGSGYLAAWVGNIVSIYKSTTGTLTLLASSVISITKDATTFHNLEFIATETTAGTVNLTAILDGVLMVQYSDSSSPYTDGTIGAQFRDVNATNYIDEKTIEITMGGSPSSSNIKGLANVAPQTVPYWTLYIASPTYGGAPSPSLRSFNMDPAVGSPGTVLVFADGSTLTVPGVQAVNDAGGADGVWYYGMSLNIQTLQPVWYLSQTAPTPEQIQAFLADGLVPLTLGQSTTVPPGSYTLVLPGYGTVGTGSTQRRYLS